jgi:AcrR family transcriptional regulator
MTEYTYPQLARTRLTQAESRERTRQYLLDATLRLMMEKGFIAASVEDITREAGFSRGAFYSNFSSKKELFMELLKRMQEEDLLALDALMHSHIESTHLGLQQLILSVFRTIQRNGAGAIARAEARLLASRDPEFRTWFTAFNKHATTHLVNLIRSFCVQAGHDTARSPQLITECLIFLVEGVQLARLSGENGEEIPDEHIVASSIEGLIRSAQRN